MGKEKLDVVIAKVIDFFVNLGYNICDSCGTTTGHVLGYYDQKDYDRLHFRKKSIYQRKYHYEKKIDQVSKRLQYTWLMIKSIVYTIN